ncbi:solute carrier family 35 member C2 isoform X2 [Folsomia candida]|uniref:solute carrier family 35 member C2 isoform X2 n=1 Tax=Folsomia candida TaxID=158441 RepID=UPI000B8EEDD6|nr:solute carrier family 35 member C2 isoform X2 [Folsomia candida]
MQKKVQEFTILDDDDDIQHRDQDAFLLGRYDEEDLFTQLQQKKKQRRHLFSPTPGRSPSGLIMLRLRWCAVMAAVFRAPTGPNRSLYYIIVRNILLILVYYVLSIGLTFYQNHLLKEIHFPLSVVLCHLVVKFFLSSVIRLCYELWTGKKRVVLDCDNWCKKLSLIGISGGLDIGFSNWGQEFITVSLYTMSKSTAIIFILGFALVLKLEEKHWSLIVIVSMISGGLLMFTYKSTQFDLLGFSLIMAASFLSGMRWTICQLIIQKSKLGLHNPIDMVYHVQPWMIAAVLPFALFFEGSLITSHSLPLQSHEDKAHFLTVVNAVLIGALMAFFMEIAEYLVVTFTSSLTLSVAGIFKEICTLCLAVIFNGDQLTFINFIGLLMCFTGIICHVTFKVMKSTNTGGGDSDVSTVVASSNNATSTALSSGSSSCRQGGPSSTFLTETSESTTPLLLGEEGCVTKEVDESEDEELWGK